MVSNNDNTASHSDMEFACAICYEEYTDPTVTACGHLFCYGCLQKCKLIRPRCPTCNSDLELTESIQVFALSFLDKKQERHLSKTINKTLVEIKSKSMSEIKSDNNNNHNINIVINKYELIFSQLLKKKKYFVLSPSEKIWGLINKMRALDNEIFTQGALGVYVIVGLFKALVSENNLKSILWRHSAQLMREIQLKTSNFMMLITIFSELNFHAEENLLAQSSLLFTPLLEMALELDEPTTLEQAYNVCFYLRANVPFFNDICTSKALRINEDWLLLWIEALFSTKNYNRQNRLTLWHQLCKLTKFDLHDFVANNKKNISRDVIHSIKGMLAY